MDFTPLIIMGGIALLLHALGSCAVGIGIYSFLVERCSSRKEKCNVGCKFYE